MKEIQRTEVPGNLQPEQLTQAFMDVRQKIISFSQEAKKRGLIVEGRTFLTKRIKL